MDLIVVESPTKAKTLSKFLGKGYEVLATKGHIKDLPKSTLGIDVDHDFKPDYLLVPKKEDVVNDLKAKAKKSRAVYLATDPDREGEAIAKHVSEILDDDGKWRIVFHEITKEAVEEALQNPRSVDKHLVNAQIARRVLDRLVGYKLSPLLWKKVRRGLSAGRVQTVTVRLIVEREREIDKFKRVEYWEIFCQLKEKTGGNKTGFVVQLIKVNDRVVEIKNQQQADDLTASLKKSAFKVLSVNKKEVRKSSYPPFTTSTMTQAAARVFGWSAKRTMSTAQHLYEEGHITYHRTDSTNVASSAIEKLRKYIGATYGKEYLNPEIKLFKTQSKVAQEAHEAVRPTNVNYVFRAKNTKYAKDEETLYNMIFKRFVATQMAPSVFDETTINVEAKDKTTTYLLRASGQIMKFAGWKKLYINNGKETSLDGEMAAILPEVKENELLELIKTWGDQKFTQPPARYTEASLIRTLEKLGIGRPSTYAPTISTIQLRNYVEKEEGKFIPTPVGVAVNDFLLLNFPDIFEYAFTAEMEDDLDKIANGELKWAETIDLFWRPFNKKLSGVEKKSKRVKIEVEKTGRKCPECKKGELVIRIGRFGKFVSCSTFPDCKYTEKYVEKVGLKCPECKKGEVIVKKTQKGKKFFGCSLYPECKWASWRNPKLMEKTSEKQKI